jgi:hypothetical protein
LPFGILRSRWRNTIKTYLKKNQDVKVETALNWFRTGSKEGFLKMVIKFQQFSNYQFSRNSIMEFLTGTDGCKDRQLFSNLFQWKWLFKLMAIHIFLEGFRFADVSE